MNWDDVKNYLEAYVGEFYEIADTNGLVCDENGERIPVIDKRTGQQKVDKRNRKQWKCHTEESTDWNSKENAKVWRKDLADTINAANEQLGIDLHWEHHSFKEQEIDREPTTICPQDR